MDKLIMGRYIPGNSVIHRMDPRAKLLAMFGFLFIIFLAGSPLEYAILLAFVLLGVKLSGIKLSFFLNGLKPMLPLILFTVIFQMLFTAGQTLLWQIGPIKIYVESLINMGYIFMRFVLIIFMSTLLTLTTQPLVLADGIETALAPLNKLHVPVHEIGLMLSISLRFIPTLMDDTTMIMNAQKSRGMDFGEGNIIQKVKSVIPILIPLFVQAFRRAEDLSVAMESRGYQGGQGRTKYRALKWGSIDTLLVVSLVALAIVLFVIK